MSRLLAFPQAAAAAVALARLSHGRSRRPPLAAPGGERSPHAGARPRISVVVPARDEAQRIGPCLEALAGDPEVDELLVIDDRSGDGTAEVAARAGARVVAGAEPPPGWVGKPWALQQGVEAARGDVVVCLDADTRPRPGLAGALARALGDADTRLLTAGARFVCDTAGERWLHPSFLASLVYRFGPSDAPGGRLVSNGQCTAVRREPFLAAGGYAHAAGFMTDDTALAIGLRGSGWEVEFRDAGGLLEVDMHDDLAGVWREWGRSIALADVTPRALLAADVALVWLVLALPALRALTGRATALDVGLLLVRAGMLVALAPVYARRGAPYWLSPLADPATAARITWSALRPPRTWRGRVYGAGGRAPR